MVHCGESESTGVPGAFVEPRAESSPGNEIARGWEAAHVVPISATMTRAVASLAPG
jgi:hypothetical protein